MTGPKNPACRLERLLDPAVLQAFNRSQFEREGYWVWEGVLTEEGRTRFISSLIELQRKNDTIAMDTDWEAIDFAGRGMDPVIPENVTPEAKAACCGGSEQDRFMSRNWRAKMHIHGLFGPEPTLVTSGFESQGIMPEFFPAAYDEFIYDVVTGHPQMMELLRQVLGDSFILDHLIMLNRAPESRGRTWHAHQYRQGASEVEDDIGTGTQLTTEYLTQQCVRTLCYPAGATPDDGGELAVIPGAHLYRIPFKSMSHRSDLDEDMKAGWLQGKIHAFTGKSLEIVHLTIPPGSMVSFVHHMPHYVGYRQPGAGVRLGLLMAYRTPDPQAEPERWSAGVPAEWADRMHATGRFSDRALRILRTDNPVAL